MLSVLISSVNQVQKGNPVKLKVILDMITDLNKIVVDETRALAKAKSPSTKQLQLQIAKLVELIAVNHVSGAIILDTMDNLTKDDFVQALKNNVRRPSDLVRMHEVIIKEK